MKRFLIEGSCDGALFAETVDAMTKEDAEAFAIERLCEAWGETYGPDTTLDDLGDAATVTEYSAERYARDYAMEMLAVIRDALPHIADEVEQRKNGGNAEYFADLEKIESRMVDVMMKAEGKKL
ncbi:hypothetical protein VH570_19455 [Sphingobium sp. HT1-2]|uniref:hypothetical protein n=1 Tax=Sphingobium sp. HT1-2 TaxID=3111640 RepID=UPI003C037A3A